MKLKVNGVFLHYLKLGEGEPIILVHGNGESHNIFKETITELSKRYTVYAVDMRGHGESDDIDELHYVDMARDILDFIKANEINKPYYFGFSDGGIVGLLAAAENSNVFKKIIIAGANSCPTGIKKRWMLFFKIIYFFSRSKLLKVIFTEPIITADLLAKISVKTIVMAGEKDVVKLSDTMFIANNIPKAELVIIKGEGHMSYVFNNEKLTNIIYKYIEEK